MLFYYVRTTLYLHCVWMCVFVCFQIAVFTQGAQFLNDFWTEERVSFVLTVSRGNLLNGTLSSLVSANDTELKKPLRVSCVNSILIYMYIRQAALIFSVQV